MASEIMTSEIIVGVAVGVLCHFATRMADGVLGLVRRRLHRKRFDYAVELSPAPGHGTTVTVTNTGRSAIEVGRVWTSSRLGPVTISDRPVRIAVGKSAEFACAARLAPDARVFLDALMVE